MVAPDILKRAGDFGTAVHDTLDLYESGKLDHDNLDPILAKILEAWERCKAYHKIEVQNTELPIVSTKYQYAGRFDVVAAVRGVNSIIELKSRPYNAMTDPLQVAAYLQGYNESYPKDKASRRFFCGFDLKGGYNFFEIKKIPGQPEHLHMFLNALGLYKWKGVSKL